jgi:hypothetical protein
MAIAVPEVLRMSDWYVPQPTQLEFHDSPALYPLQEGGRGGGKSIALLAEAIYQCLIVPGCNCLLLRRTLTAAEKGGIQDHFFKYVPPGFYKNWNGQSHCVTFHNGSKLFFGHIKSDRDLTQYQSAEYLFIGWDELTQFTYAQWDYLKGSNRCPINFDVYGMPTRARMAGATNPNGIGSAWVKALWITKKPPAGEMILNYDQADYHAIHSTYESNRVYRNDLPYIKKLLSLSDPVLREAWIPGSWNILAGQYFQNFDGIWDDRLKRYKGRHVRNVSEVEFQAWQPRWISIDWGYQHACVTLWWTRGIVTDGFGRKRNMIICYREYVTRRMNETVLAAEIGARTGLMPGMKEEESKKTETITNVYLSPERFNKQNSENTIADILGDGLRPFGIPRPERAHNDRVAGWQLCSTAFDCDGVVILDTCNDVIESIPKLMRDEKNIEDAVKEGNDLFLDVNEAFRYGMMSHATEAAIPREVAIQEQIRGIKNPTHKYMEYLRLSAQKPGDGAVAYLPRRPLRG